MSPWSALVGFWLLALFLSGCAAPDPGRVSVGVLEQRHGRFSVQSTQVGELPETVQGNFVWRKLSVGWQLDLNSPLGATLARLTVRPDSAVLEQPDSPMRRAASGEQLLASVLGAAVPVDALEDWMKGRIGRGSDVREVKRDSFDRIESFTQGSWRVNFDRYGQSGPELVRVSGRQGTRTVSLRLVLDGVAKIAGASS
jgi:outer membrane lipoprotein LolB